MRRTALLALVALAAVPAAWGQVAAPALLPARPGVTDPTASTDPGIVPINPALLAFPAQTKAALGVLRSERNREPFLYGGPPLPPGTTITVPSESFRYEGSYAGAAFHGAGYGMAVEALVVNSVEGSERLDSRNGGLGAALLLGGDLAAGAGYREQTGEDNNTRSRGTGYSAGLSLRMWERLYVGALAGQERLANRATDDTGWNLDGSRTFYGGGIGYLGEGPVRMHMELWAAFLGGVKDNKNNAEIGPAAAQAVIAEARIHHLLLGYNGQLASGSLENASAKASLEVESHELTAGVAEENGFALLFHYGWARNQFDYTFKQSTTTSKLKSTTRTQALTLVWQY
jgi:hypothetical protein